MSQPTDLNDPAFITKTKPAPFFPNDAPLPLEIHGLDSTKATVKGFCDGDELLVSVDDNSQIWVRLVDGGTHGSTSLFLSPEKAAAIGNAFLRFAELARERAKEKNDG